MIVLHSLLLLVLITAPGLACWFAWGQPVANRLRVLEWGFLVVLTGLTAVSWTALLLAEFNRFSLPLLVGILLAATGMIVGWGVRSGRSFLHIRQLTWEWPSAGALFVLGVAIVLSPQPFEYVVGGRDHGVYVNTAVHIARQGGIVIVDESLTAVPPSSRNLLIRPETRLLQAGFPGPWSEGLRLTGLTIRDTANGIYLPHAFHLYPALMAVFFAVGGIELGLATTMVLGLLGGLAIYLVVRRLFGWHVGLTSYFLLTISVTQMWFTQYPSAEIMVQLFFWGGLLSALLMLETKSRVTAVLTGVCFGLLHLAKLDTVLVPVSLVLFFLYHWIRRQFHTVYWWAVVPYLLLSLHALLHAFFIATIYFIDHAVRILLPQLFLNRIITAASGHPYPLDILNRLLRDNWGYLLLALLLVAGVVWLLRLLRQRLDRLLTQVMRRQRWIQLATAVTLGGYALLTAVSATAAEPSFLLEARWSGELTLLYLRPLGLLLGLIGLLVLIVRSNTTGTHFALVLLLGNTLPLFILGAGTAPDHFWVIRRYMTIAFPTFIFAAVWLLWGLRPRTYLPWVLVLIPVGLYVALAVGLWQRTSPMVRVVEYDGLTAQLEAFASSTSDDAVLLFGTGSRAQRLDLPLWLLFDKTVFTVRKEMVADPRLATAVSHWVTSGRPVYWLAADGGDVPNWPDWQADYTQTQIIAAPLVEAPLDRTPQHVGLYLVHLDVYRLLPQTAVSTPTHTATTIHIGSASNNAVANMGLQRAERFPGLTARRMMQKEVTVPLSEVGELVEVVLLVGNGRSDSLPAPHIAVYLDGTLLDTIQVNNNPQLIRLPLSTALLPAETSHELKIVVDSMTMPQNDSTVSQIYLDWIKLISAFK
jgi:hypothetical protein